MNLPPGTLLLSGIVGSQAYGLATPESDVDRLGVYAAPTRDFHGLTTPLESVVFKAPEPDATYHEAAKMCRLMMNSNPSVMELLWLPTDLYETKTDLGLALIDIRQSFPSKDRVRRAYLGYATTQFDKLLRRGDGSFSADLRKRTAKHATHLLRLLHQGFGLYSTGRLQVKVDDLRCITASARRCCWIRSTPARSWRSTSRSSMKLRRRCLTGRMLRLLRCGCSESVRGTWNLEPDA